VLVAVGAGLADQRFEEAGVFACFGVPEDADGEASGRVFESFDGAVVIAGCRAEAFTELAEALVVV
jgi:hypothetical protein